MIVLYDGWSLANAPGSTAALHLLLLLSACPEDVQPIVALPAQTSLPLPARVRPVLLPAENTSSGRLSWEQRGLPRMAREQDADLLHLVSLTPPLFGRQRVLISPAEPEGWNASPGRSVQGRLREAAASGGMTRLAGLIWPADLPAPHYEGEKGELLTLPPAVHPLFLFHNRQTDEDLDLPDLPETYVLYHGPHQEADLRRLLDTWSWAAGPVGGSYPLLIAGLDPSARARLEALLPLYQVEETIRVLPELTPSELVELYRGCAVLLHPAPIMAWENPIRLALALGKPVAAADEPLTGALVGPAAYLAPLEPDGRALGAALITIIVEEGISRRLSNSARERVAAWDPDGFREGLKQAYQEALKR